jgi:dTDP-4-dehydrorhamnose reductase
MILVFGKTGQVASELQHEKNLTLIGRKEANLLDLDTCKKLIHEYKPDAVINAAAYTAVDDAENDRALADAINGIAPTVIAQSCRMLNIPFVHISSDYVFNGSGSNPKLNSDIPSPINAYGRSKLLGEDGIRNSGCVFAIIRTSWIISPYGNNFVKTMYEMAKKKSTLSIVSDQIGGPTPAKSIAQACLRVAEELIKNPSKAGTYHLSGTPNTSWAELATKIFQHIESDVKINHILTKDYPTPAMRPLNSRLDCSAIEQAFNIHRPSWDKSLKNILKQIREIK